jgi:hypothetical protein
MLRGDLRFKATVGQGMEIQRAQASPDAIIESFDKLRHVLNNVYSEFIWNMDEVVHVELPDAHPDIVYVPHDDSESTVPIGIS